jgi:hypothetical protein
MVWSVRQQHAVLEEVEQSAFGNTPELQQLRLDLACTRIRRETFDVSGENGDVSTVLALDQRRENPVTAENTMGIPVERGSGDCRWVGSPRLAAFI